MIGPRSNKDILCLVRLYHVGPSGLSMERIMLGIESNPTRPQG